MGFIENLENKLFGAVGESLQYENPVEERKKEAERKEARAQKPGRNPRFDATLREMQAIKEAKSGSNETTSSPSSSTTEQVSAPKDELFKGVVTSLNNVREEILDLRNSLSSLAREDASATHHQELEALGIIAEDLERCKLDLTELSATAIEAETNKKKENIFKSFDKLIAAGDMMAARYLYRKFLYDEDFEAAKRRMAMEDAEAGERDLAKRRMNISSR